MRQPSVSVAIPAHNEAERIGELLNQLCGPAGDRVSEVIVCASGCTDATADVVEAVARRDCRVSVFAAPVGKARAWNDLVRRVTGELTIFIDADLRLKSGALEALVDAMIRAPQLVIATGVPLVDLRGVGLRKRLHALWTLPLGFDFVYGGLYAVRLKLLASAMQDCGLVAAGGPPCLPPDVVVEDILLDWLLSAEQFVVVQEAVAYVEPLDLSDMLRSRARQAVAQAQIRDAFPAVADCRAGCPARCTSGPRRLWQRLTGVQPASKVWLVLGMVLRRFLLALFRSRLRALRERMSADVRTGRGGAVLATSGRVLSKGPAPAAETRARDRTTPSASWPATEAASPPAVEASEPPE
jgi:hypothetical protein